MYSVRGKEAEVKETRPAYCSEKGSRAFVYLYGPPRKGTGTGPQE